uniref:BTB domain-containing protein n=1 Tax=Caenorhabditis tropicalis TaxID=1561998 RepID=A0A1I7T665_9PELO
MINLKVQIVLDNSFKNQMIVRDHTSTTYVNLDSLRIPHYAPSRIHHQMPIADQFAVLMSFAYGNPQMTMTTIE